MLCRLAVAAMGTTGCDADDVSLLAAKVAMIVSGYREEDGSLSWRSVLVREGCDRVYFDQIAVMKLRHRNDCPRRFRIA